jgi:gluconokinase
MGVSGAGKSSVGADVARLLGLPFVDGDDLHPAANVAKMTTGVALTDDDRVEWLQSVGGALAVATGAVVACSALRRAHRDVIRERAPSAWFAHLMTARSELESRIAGRRDHFMPVSLLDSQLATLEPLATDEAGMVVTAVDIESAARAIVDAVQ